MSNSLDTAQHFIFVTQIYFCSMYAVVLWDWIVSIPREWTLIWKTTWSPVKFAYIFCRYWPILVIPYVLNSYIVDHSYEACVKIYKIPVILAMWNQAAAEVVLLIRTYAFFNCNKILLAVLSFALAGVLAYQIYVPIAQMDMLPFVTPPFDKGPCLPQSKPHSAHLLGFFMASLVFDSAVTFLTLWKAFKLRSESGAIRSPIIQTFIREGVFYYILISVANLVNGIFYLQPRQVISALNIPLSIMFPDILACRLILDLRERGYEISQPTVVQVIGNLPTRAVTESTTLETSGSVNKSLTPGSTCTIIAKTKGLRGFVSKEHGPNEARASESHVLTTLSYRNNVKDNPASVNTDERTPARFVEYPAQ